QFGTNESFAAWRRGRICRLSKSDPAREGYQFLMSRQCRTSNALRALHRVLVKARHLALTTGDAGPVARVLDHAEYMATLPTETDDWVPEFRRTLQSLGDSMPEFAGLLREFDEDV